MFRIVWIVALGAVLWTGQTGVSGPTALETLKAVSEAQAELYDRVASSVVRIRTREFATEESFRDIPHAFPFGDAEGGEELFEFWRRQHPGGKTEEGDKPGEGFEYESGIGSGIIARVDESGLWILTNNHVIENAVKAEIEFTEGAPLEDFKIRSKPGEPDRNTFLDWRSDLAVIHIPAEAVKGRPHTPATFGDSDRLRPGEIVFTLGAPLDREWTFSQGIVSGKGREDVLPDRFITEDIPEIRYNSLIQTTAFINVGNSGGPLLDVEGRVVGINVAIQTAGGFSNGFIGIGFSIPSNRAKFVVDQLIDRGKVVRGFLGVVITQTTLKDEYPNPHPYRAVLVTEVGPDSPAEKGGVREGDIILSFNGTSIRSTQHLQEMIALAPLEKPASVEVFRGKDRVTLAVPVGMQPDEMEIAQVAKGAMYVPELGASLRNTKEKEAAYFNSKGGFKGVWIEEVDDEGPLQEGDVKIPPGSLITEIEYKPVEDIEKLRTVLDELRAKAGDKKEKLVMLKYVSGSAGDVEKFQVVRLRFE